MNPSPLYEDPALYIRHLWVPREHVAWVRFIIEAYDGMATLHATGDGTVVLAATADTLSSLDQVIEDLQLKPVQ